MSLLIVNGPTLSSRLSSSSKSPARSRILLLCVCLGVAALPNCARWATTSDYTTESKSDAGTAYAKLLKVLEQKGYHVTEQRDSDHYVQVRAHIDENFVSRQSFIAAQIDAAGVVHFTPSGYLVRGDKIHKKLASELLDLEYAMRSDVGVEPGASASASAAPAPTAPVEPVASAPAASASVPAPVTPAPVATTPPPKPHNKPKAATPAAPPASAKPSNDDWVPVK